MELTPSPPHLLRLPDELLHQIFGYAAGALKDTFACRGWYTAREKVFADWCLLCRRLYPIARAFLYANVDVNCVFSPSRHEWLLGQHQSFQRYATLRPLVRNLTVHYEGPSINTLPYVATDLIAWCTHVRSFSLSGLGSDDQAWMMLRQGLFNFQTLMELSLADPRKFNLDLELLLGTLDELACPQLTTLSLNGIGNRRLRDRPNSPGEPLTAALTTLKLRNFLATPADLEALVRRPTRLQNFELQYTFPEASSYDQKGASTDWSLATLQPILSIHKASLRSIKLNHINRGGLAGFDMRDFERLEMLSLSTATVCSASRLYDYDEHVLDVLFAPNLRALELDFAREYKSHTSLDSYSRREGLEDFDEAEERWLHTLAHMAIRKRCPLREIKVIFRPRRYDESQSAARYPWDRMDDLDEELRPYRIRICYNTPTVSRAEFDEVNRRRVSLSMPYSDRLRMPSVATTLDTDLM
ncbi:uncharacterized protein DSM5745_10339 [Aspergillus mulundensis]|uniref:F-box domain-containing protein n=1 Tax=Aspergillus mulundensis TaxID=1810919 RepID=A0A3D8QNG5_9EURO|nr:hypothetical protein DSM5745_10339 [Aspergillus mulundensis]RDW63228.1 hypothetical protein DSM5745_10339 [Aspergillus mulundensis]